MNKDRTEVHDTDDVHVEMRLHYTLNELRDIVSMELKVEDIDLIISTLEPIRMALQTKMRVTADVVRSDLKREIYENLKQLTSSETFWVSDDKREILYRDSLGAEKKLKTQDVVKLGHMSEATAGFVFDTLLEMFPRRVHPRRCEKCGGGMSAGFISEDLGTWCSEECLFTDGYTREDYNKDYDNDVCFYTEWDADDHDGEGWDAMGNWYEMNDDGEWEIGNA